MTQKTYSDLSGDGGSQIFEQVVAIKTNIKANLSGIKNIVAIGSAKGGVGKSTMTMQLGAALCARNKKTTLLDADINGPSLARLSGLQNTALLPGANGLIVPKTASGLGVLSFGSLVPESQAVDFASVATGDSHTWRATKEFSTLADFLGHTEWGELDFLLVDLPPGAERGFQFAEFLGLDTLHVLVTIPSEISQGVVSRGIDALTKAEAKILGYVENMSGYYCKDCKEVKPLFAHAKVNLPIPCLGQIPFDPALAEACDAGRTITEFPDSPAALAIEAVANKIIERAQL